MAQTFTKEERLSSFTEINQLVKEGAVLFVYPFRVTYQIKKDCINKILVSVPKKNFKQAVHRNLLKRRIRESYRKNKEQLSFPYGASANIMFVYIAKEILEYRYIESKIKDILGKIAQTVEADC